MNRGRTEYIIKAGRPDDRQAGIPEWWIEVSQDGEVLMLLGPFSSQKRARQEVDARPVTVSA